jgi:GNAT superfamily N-acetyltransferase
MIVEVGITYLEMTDSSQLKPKRADIKGLEIRRAEVPLPEFNRFLYTAVGGDWYWIDRLGWTYQEWSEWVNRPDMHTWVAYIGGSPVGYFELEKKGGDVEIAQFGLLPNFIGSGLGAHLLTESVEIAWDSGASRVWLNTCTLDHPSAIHNYQARGFKIYDSGTYTTDVPERPIGPWPNSGREPSPDSPVVAALGQ